MITLHTWKTPNGRKAAIMLEETGLAYAVVPVDISKGEQHDPAFLAISPNAKVPAIVDEEGVDERTTLFETGAILIHLAEKAHVLLPSHGQRRADVLAWVFWASTGLAPMLGQWNYFAVRAPERDGPAIKRFTEEAARLFGVMERRLEAETFLGGPDYTIADVAAYTWTAAVLPVFREQAPEALEPTPAIERWLEEIGARPAVRRGMMAP